MNDFLVPERVAAVAATLLGEELTLANKFNKTLSSEFIGGRGSSISVRINSAAKAGHRSVFSTADYVPESLEEQSLQVRISEEIYHQAVVGYHEGTLSLEDFTKQVLVAQSRAVGTDVNAAVAAILSDVPVSTIAFNADKPKSALIRARAQLRTNGVGADTPLHVLAGVNAYAALLEADPDQAEVSGLAPEESTVIDPDAVYVYTQDSVAVVLVAPKPVNGATKAASVTAGQAAATHVMGFDPRSGNSLSTVSVLVGVQEMPLAVIRDGAVELVEHGGIVRINTGA